MFLRNTTTVIRYYKIAFIITFDNNCIASAVGNRIIYKILKTDSSRLQFPITVISGTSTTIFISVPQPHVPYNIINKRLQPDCRFPDHSDAFIHSRYL